MFWGLYVNVKDFSGLNPIIFIKNFFPVMAFAFSTSTSNATIPMNIDTLAEKWVSLKRSHPLQFH